MPWSNQNGGGGGWKGGSGGGGGGPWGSGPGGGGGNQPPDLEEILKRSQDKVRQVMGGGGGSGLFGPLLFVAAIVGCAAIAWYGFFYKVNADQQGVVMRFGKFDRQEGAGLHNRLPYPIEEVVLQNVTEKRKTEIGLRTSDNGRGASGLARDVREESLMLTGDENIVDIGFVVIWQIRSAPDYLFDIRNPDDTVTDIAESAMRDIVGQSKIQQILTEARLKIEAAVQKLMQQKLDSYKAGINILQVQLQRVDPPAEVIDAFRDVQAARADLETKKNVALGYANQVVPQAKGEAERILQDAEGYKQQSVAEATGKTARFTQIYDQYKRAPEVTRERMYLETMERVMSGTDKILLDPKGGAGVVPYLPLGELKSKSKE